MIVVTKAKALACLFTEYKKHCSECWKVPELKEVETIHITISSVCARRYSENDLVTLDEESFGLRMSTPGAEKGKL